MKRIIRTLILPASIALLASPLPVRAQQPPGPSVQFGGQQGVAQSGRKIGPPPEVAAPLPFVSKDGRIKGWRVVIPGNRPLATPAVADGRVFLGGGFGSNEFYAFDAVTGQKLWTYRTNDDGPSAAVVQDGQVAFNMESGELEVLTVDGKAVWKKWLGDPLMSMPALDRGRLFVGFPNVRGDRQHYLICFELKTGRELWKKPIAGEIITAPVLAGERVYLATLEGTVYCFRQADGELVWRERTNATSSPVIGDATCYFCRREEVADKKAGQELRQQTERLTQRGVGVKGSCRDLRDTERAADYLDYNKRAASPNEKLLQSYDNSVGFAQGKGDAKIEQAVKNLGQASVAGIWAYQGSKPFISNGLLYSAMGDVLKCVDPKKEQVVWRRVVEPRGANAKGELLDSVLTPPVLVNGKVFVGTTFGEVYCLSARNGGVLWSVNLGEPILFQPAVAKGRVYVPTGKGSLFCLETGDPRDDGWLMWGGSAGHNGLAK